MGGMFCFGWRRRLPAAVVLGGLALLAAVWSPARVTAQPPPDNGALLRELAERLLAQPVPAPPGVTLPPVRLLPGALPSDLPVTPTLPPGARLIGSVVRPVLFGGPGVTGPEVGEGVEIVLDVPGTADAVMTHFTRELAAAGFTPPTGGFRAFRPGGFLPSVGISPSAFFCRDERGPFVEVAVSAREGRPADVRLRIQPFPGPCAAPPGPSGPPPPPSDPVPPLEPPAGAVILPGGGGGSNFSRSYDAVAQTSMSVAELEAHYARQLIAAGWTRVGGGADGPLAWSVWRVPAEEPRPWEMLTPGERQGFFYALEGPGANRRSLHVRLVSAGQAGGPGSGITIATPLAVPIAPPQSPPPGQ